MEILTNDAKFLVSALYKKYVERRDFKTPKNKAVYFNTITQIHQEIMPEWLYEDVEFTCFELKKYNYISGLAADNTLIGIRLTTEAIAQLENQFSDKVDKILDYMAKIKSAVPFI